MAGPINRFQVFERQIARRRWDASEFFTGAERLLFGVAQVIILGGWLISQIEARILAGISQTQNFFVSWIYSIVDWVELYFVFAGYSSIALGLSLMMGLRLEENFNRPWAAKDLIDFWLRWHITLSQWVRDYVFQPITALTRSPVIGLTAAMLVIGLWHESSTYYVLWALWQVLGIVLTRLVKEMISKNSAMQKKADKLVLLSPFYVLGWLSLANPVITRFLDLSL
jgi:alginate O-acetyltransferase complex protein AlgI